MAFTNGLVLAYKGVVTSAFVNAIIENIVSHDHRGDGTQGAPLIGSWTNVSGFSASTGWSLSGTPRYRAIPGGAVVDVTFTRTGATITGSDMSAGFPGNVVDSPMGSGWPAAARPGKTVVLRGDVGQTPAFVRVGSDGTWTLVYTSPGGPIASGDTITVRETVWAG